MEIYEKTRVRLDKARDPAGHGRAARVDKALSEAFPAGITPDDYSDAMALACFHDQ